MDANRPVASAMRAKPHYLSGDLGRPPIPLDRMLRMCFLQQWFNLSDPAVEEAFYDMASIRAFARIDLGQALMPDESTVCKFRHLLEEHNPWSGDFKRSQLVSDKSQAWAQSSKRRLFTRRVRQRTIAESAILKCTRRRKARMVFRDEGAYRS